MVKNGLKIITIMKSNVLVFAFLVLILSICTITLTFEVDFGNNSEIVLQYPDGRNVTLTKAINSVPLNDDYVCDICCDCNGVKASMCMCGNTWCCYNNYKGTYYTCSSSTCCNEGSTLVGCWQNTGCAACSW